MCHVRRLGLKNCFHPPQQALHCLWKANSGRNYAMCTAQQRNMAPQLCCLLCDGVQGVTLAKYGPIKHVRGASALGPPQGVQRSSGSRFDQAFYWTALDMRQHREERFFAAAKIHPH
jgi:hypothetical protein